MVKNFKIQWDEEYINLKRNKLGFGNSNSLKKYLHFPQKGNKFVVIPQFTGHAIDSVKEIDVHFLNGEKVMCLRTIGKRCSICDFLDSISDYKTAYKEIDDIRKQLFARTYGLVPIVLFGKDSLSEAIKYSRWNIFLLAEFYDDYIKNREYGKKCLQFKIGFEIVSEQVSDDQEFFKLEPFVINDLKFSINLIKEQYESLPEAFDVFAQGLGYISDNDKIKTMLEEYISNSKQSVSIQEDIVKPADEFVDEDILTELDDIKTEESTEDKIDKIFEDIESNKTETEEESLQKEAEKFMDETDPFKEKEIEDDDDEFGLEMLDL